MSDPTDTPDTPDARAPGGRFQPGQSGNKKGRPRKGSTVGASMLTALDEKVTVNDGGRRRKITKREAAVTQLANMSASGDLRAGKLAFDLAQKAEERAAVAAPAPVPLTPSDREIVDRFLARLALIAKEPVDEPDHV